MHAIHAIHWYPSRTSHRDTQVWQRLRAGALVAAATAPKLTVGGSAAEAGGTSWVQPAPAKLLGFTYVSVFLETLVVASAADIMKPTLTVSVYSAKGQLVESAQVGDDAVGDACDPPRQALTPKRPSEKGGPYEM